MKKFISTDRLELRKLQIDDFPNLFTLWNNKELLKFTYHVFTPTLEDSKERVRQIINWYSSMNYSLGPFLIYAEDVFVGFCGLDFKSAALKEYELYYIISPNHQQKGYASEAAKALVDVGFSYLNAERIAAEAVVDNASSCRILEKLGMQLEGKMRRKFHREEGDFHDLLVYAILRNEWEAKQV
ncbi:MAG: GNAT family N-acetyltransferase [Ferruginibacter sp.]